MWTLLAIIAFISLLVFSLQARRNAVWGGVTIGFFAGIIIAIFRSGFDWSIVYKAIVVCILIGSAAELLGLLGDIRKRKL